MSSKSKRTNGLIEEYATLIELADVRELNDPERARIQGIRAELRGLAGDGEAYWDHDGGLRYRNSRIETVSVRQN